MEDNKLLYKFLGKDLARVLLARKGKENDKK